MFKVLYPKILSKKVLFKFLNTCRENKHSAKKRPHFGLFSNRKKSWYHKRLQKVNSSVSEIETQNNPYNAPSCYLWFDPTYIQYRQLRRSKHIECQTRHTRNNLLLSPNWSGQRKAIDGLFGQVPLLRRVFRFLKANVPTVKHQEF